MQDFILLIEVGLNCFQIASITHLLSHLQMDKAKTYSQIGWLAVNMPKILKTIGARLMATSINRTVSGNGTKWRHISQFAFHPPFPFIPPSVACSSHQGCQMRPQALHPGAIQGKEGINFCSVAERNHTPEARKAKHIRS